MKHEVPTCNPAAAGADVRKTKWKHPGILFGLAEGRCAKKTWGHTMGPIWRECISEWGEGGGAGWHHESQINSRAACEVGGNGRRETRGWAVQLQRDFYPWQCNTNMQCLTMFYKMRSRKKHVKCSSAIPQPRVQKPGARVANLQPGNRGCGGTTSAHT